MVDPLTRVFLECHAEFARRMANGKLRSPQRWRRALFCSRVCAAEQYRRRKASLKLPHYLAGLEPPPPLPRPKRSCSAAPGRPATKTGRRAIERVERTSRILQAKFAGHTFREIGLAEGVSMQRVHRLYWRALDANPPNRRR